jgi:hypothetical protein
MWNRTPRVASRRVLYNNPFLSPPRREGEPAH